jgi:ABC-type lipoprotein release transport system permease subunit
MIRFHPGTDATAAKKRLRAVFEERATGELKPRDVTDFSAVGETPLVISALMAALALATLGHVLVSTVRRRGRELAVLKALGMERAQVSLTVACQASTYALTALLVGVPLGLAAGRWGWRLFAEELGVVPESVVPVLAVLLVIPAAIVAANAIAALPGWIAARTRPALVLRAE